MLTVVGDIKRLDSQAFTSDQHAPPNFIPECESKHAIQALDEAVTVLSVGVNHHPAVGLSLEAVPPGFQFTTQLAKVADFSIAYQPQPIILARDGLVVAGKIDDGKPAHADCARAVRMHALVVRAAMRGNQPHSRQLGRIRAHAVELNESVYAAHDVSAIASTRSTGPTCSSHRVAFPMCRQEYRQPMSACILYFSSGEINRSTRVRIVPQELLRA